MSGGNIKYKNLESVAARMEAAERLSSASSVSVGVSNYVFIVIGTKPLVAQVSTISATGSLHQPRPPG